MTPIDRLIALAKAATPGPWVVIDNLDSDFIDIASDETGLEVARVGRHSESCEDSAFIAACDPQTIRALCAENKRLTAEVERLRGEGEVTVTTNDRGECVAVTRTNDEHRILSIIWEAPQPTPSALAPGNAADCSCARCAEEREQRRLERMLAAHSTSAAAEGAVTDAMVEAACVAFEKHPTTLASDYETPAMRAALEAALAAAPGGERK